MAKRAYPKRFHSFEECKAVMKACARANAADYNSAEDGAIAMYRILQEKTQ